VYNGTNIAAGYNRLAGWFHAFNISEISGSLEPFP